MAPKDEVTLKARFGGVRGQASETIVGCFDGCTVDARWEFPDCCKEAISHDLAVCYL